MAIRQNASGFWHGAIEARVGLHFLNPNSSQGCEAWWAWEDWVMLRQMGGTVVCPVAQP